MCWNLATRHKNAEVEYLRQTVETCSYAVIRADVYARGGVEFLALSSGDTLRLEMSPRPSMASGSRSSADQSLPMNEVVRAPPSLIQAGRRVSQEVDHTGKKDYLYCSLDDSFLAALAEGGYQWANWPA